MEIFTVDLTGIIGWIASLTVLASFLMKNMNVLRTVNSIGALIFIVYGCLLNFSLPIIVTNFAIACINIFYIIRSKREKS
jgi:energy-converting hydrogenase Eha subunit G